MKKKNKVSIYFRHFMSIWKSNLLKVEEKCLKVVQIKHSYGKKKKVKLNQF